MEILETDDNDVSKAISIAEGTAIHEIDWLKENV